MVLCARSTDDITRIANELGDQALAVTCDVTKYQDVANAVSVTVEHFGGINLLVNNAGTIDPIARMEDSDPDAWSNAIDINLKGAYFFMRAVFPAMKNTGGVIVTISSGAAHNAQEGWSHYCASKAGLRAVGLLA